MKIKVFTLNAFAKTEKGGNPAGVVLNADGLSAEQMLLLAKKIGFSETAFVQKSAKADFKVKFFTPSAEVDICGHATVATFYLLAAKHIVQSGKYTQETKAGVLAIEILRDQTVFMDQKTPRFFENIDKTLIAPSLNISSSSVRDDLPIQIVSTGLKDIFVPIKSLNELTHIKPNFEKIKKISKKFDVIGYHVFSLETKFKSTAHCRNFAPLYDIREEAATGTSAGALSCYLFQYGRISKGQVNNLIFEQGYSMNRPSEIKAKLEINSQNITRVRVGGIAANIQQIEVVI
ncbi:phenazine biosynthesis protein PhzF [Candidatus Falkowbacteria bacterium RIFOXYC2_FULL_47_12]|uniref:Phenazine biosynthesis protein PhzF n=2 Tax=Candidatus Falkowiibacteriota TaxID=1752728 RepID=A0A1F5TLU9_9BACT|nr:MAG: phenazine biosynthesis protein PhzF [Candidatus Falkowbacteria bacterium RIFOXYA2_FULL_47_9]OGF39777.1 MAG: phenazine biosynthesis protein PhzF [Candidatus Falkowbacteria bacterium RIFOXYC2_FULL_47_12]